MPLTRDDPRLAELAAYLRQSAFAEEDVQTLLAAPVLLDEHERSLVHLIRMQALTQHLGRTQPVADQLDAAIQCTLAALKVARGPHLLAHLRELVSLTPEALDSCLPALAEFLDADAPSSPGAPR